MLVLAVYSVMMNWRMAVVLSLIRGACSEKRLVWFLSLGKTNELDTLEVAGNLCFLVARDLGVFMTSSSSKKLCTMLLSS